MADRSAIEWTDASWNPIRAKASATGRVGWFCIHVSEGCRNCYAEGFNARLGTQIDYKPQALKAGAVELFLDETMLTQPQRWRRPRRIFVCSMTDLFADFVPDEWLDRIFAVMTLAPQHTYQLLTKRPERMAAYLGSPGSDAVRTRYEAIKREVERLGGTMPGDFWFRRHIWLGFSAEDQRTFDARWAIFRNISGFGPKWASFEPLLGAIDLQISKDWCDLCGGTGLLARWPKGRCHVCSGAGRVWIMGPRSATHYPRLDWIVAGGESGAAARAMHPDWVRQLRDQCHAAGVPFLFKQWGEWGPEAGPGEARGWTGWLGGEGKPRPAQAFRVGKKRAGRLLDGVLHDAFPESKAA